MTLSDEEADLLFEDILNNFQSGNQNRAMQLALDALEKGLDEPLVLLLAGEALEQKGKGLQGVELLRRAAKIAPEEAQVWYCLGTMLIRLGFEEDGLVDLKKALSLQGDMIPALKVVASTSYRLGRLTDAEAFYKRINVLEPNSVDALAALAAIAARRHRSKDARKLATQALVLHPKNFTASMAMARADLIDMDFTRVCDRLNELLRRTDLDDDAKVAIYDLRAEALDSLDSTDAAFADYQSRNTILLNKFTPRIHAQVAERYVDRARRLSTSLSIQAKARWINQEVYDKPNHQAENRHVFLLSFPRSGTTLLEKILRSHSEVVTLEEVDHLSDIANEWLDTDAGINSLAALTAEQASHYREQYWERVTHASDEKLEGKILLDKLPLHTLSLPAISKLFPKAKILFALRDPRDVVLSCFRRRFQINPAMFELLDLQSAARFYHEVMTLADVCRTLLPIKIHEVKHEHTVANFDATIRSVLDFIGIAWEPALQEFAQNLPADPRTPSDVQLRRGLNADGLDQWKRYSAQMEPVLGLLENWQRRFEYD